MTSVTRAVVMATIIAFTTQPVSALEVMAGVATVVDGDGVAIGGVEIRLQGIAAPEDNRARRDPGGPESSANLRAYVDGKQVRCELDGTYTRGRPVGICYLSGKDIGLYQVEAGHARDCPRYSNGRYAQAELAARPKRDLSAIYPLPLGI